MSNPFFYGNPVPPRRFIDRPELNRVTGRIKASGQSIALVGEPRIGKTSILLFLAAPETRDSLEKECAERLVFTYLDAQPLPDNFSRAQFWQRALYPLYERAIAPNADSALAQAYQRCVEAQFDTEDLKILFSQARQANWRLVLMLDEFDALLKHPVLCSNAFFACLRSVASLSRGALALVTASRRPLASLIEEARVLFGHSSPYFNILSETVLGPWEEERDCHGKLIGPIGALLDRAGGRFSTEDREFILRVAGGHPFLLQVAAYELCEAYREGVDDSPEERRQKAGQRLRGQAEITLSDTWRLWTHQMRKAFTAIGLPQITLEGRAFYIRGLTDRISDLEDELEKLEQHGYITSDSNAPLGRRVRPESFLWWLADELVRTVRRDQPFAEWLQAQEWVGLLTKSEKEKLGKTSAQFASLLKEGAAELIKAAAKGIGGAIP
jgi:hypothetical protein